MAKKRTSLKGRGADIFLPADDQQTGKPAPQRAGMPARQQPEYQKATFYLKPATLDRLEAEWIADRRKNPKAKVSKSAIVEEALDAFLKKREGAGHGR